MGKKTLENENLIDLNPVRIVKLIKAVHLALDEARANDWRTPSDINPMLDLIRVYVLHSRDQDLRDNPPSDQEIFSILGDKVVDLIAQIDKRSLIAIIDKRSDNRHLNSG